MTELENLRHSFFSNISSGPLCAIVWTESYKIVLNNFCFCFNIIVLKNTTEAIT